ncbi:MAG: phosphoenolpyruvate--protein phosphotransferase [Deltaproteobacteria bacterium]|nr:phosphoenolpyruvate--protein phosphotransferase [Deltaproteobacteria bacterium]
MTEKHSGGEQPDQLGISHSEILRTLIDISRIITTSHDLDETLGHIVDLVADNMKVDTCSIYIYDRESEMLNLRATRGLNREAIGRVKMPVNEGLVGFVFETNHHVNLRDVANHERFKYFPAIGEEELSSFLGVPLIEYRKTLGVLAIQNKEDRLFTREEENLLITIASQISGLVSKALLVDRLKKESEKPKKEKKETRPSRLEGVPIAPGLALDKAVVLTRAGIGEPEYKTDKTPGQERLNLQEAIRKSEKEILDLINEVSTRISERDAAIFHAHLLFLEDRAFMEKIVGHIEKGASAPWAVSQVVKDYLKAFRALNDPYLAERAADLEDVGSRLLTHLAGGKRHGELNDASGILVATMLLPSDTAMLDPARIRGIVTSVGGHVSHAAILARSLRIPAVSGIENVQETFTDGEMLMIDGTSGEIFVNPDESITKEFERYKHTRLEYLLHLDDLKEVPCRTKCGVRIQLRANVALMQDLEDCREYGADGIGLCRTEIHHMTSSTRPTVEDLVEVYSRVMESMEGKPVSFRLLDLRSDRKPGYLNFPLENNPYMGLRSIRFQLRETGLLEDQLNAILSLPGKYPAQVVVPMISQLSELQEFRRIYNLCRKSIAEKTGREAPDLKIGMLFEVPSTVLMCEHFMGEIDFIIIGSNDLTQYIMAVDRNNPHVSHLFDPLEPAVLVLIKRLLDKANQKGVPVDLTGELASDPEASLILVGLGLRNFSMNAPLIPIIKDRLANHTVQELEELAQIALNATSAEGVRRSIQLFLSK